VSETTRCFVAAPLTPEIREKTRVLQEKLKGLDGVKWVDPDQIHLTLKFLGDVAVEDVPYVAEQLDIVATGSWPSDLLLCRLGVFPNAKSPKVLWWGPEFDSVPEKLKALHFHMEGALQALGFPNESRAFRPHLTLGRIKGAVNPIALAAGLRQPEELLSGTLPIREVHLMESRLSPTGAFYSSLARLSLEDD
jgi:2'-5' RNA ligase